MNLIDGLIDELNKSADEWNGSNMFELARMCRNAAYTISELQNDAELLRAMLSQKRTEKQCYVAENAKLRDERREYQATIDSLVDECADHKAENAKLRELVRDYERCSMHADCGLCEYDGTTSTHCPLSPCFPDIDELRELGVEVDE